ncbi:MAG: sigma-70 family RNA polymerase sigma factor [Maricaulaceae bacterium]|jgi:RNA polymerase sigma-70 factor (ECF subfamily)
MSKQAGRFVNPRAVRGPWRKYLDSLVAYRADLHRYCVRLTGSVWDGEDLMQDALVRVFSMLGKVDRNLENPRAYLIRTATNLWIDRVRRSAREQAMLAIEQPQITEATTEEPANLGEHRDAAKALFQTLHPQERAAVLLKDVFDLSLEETAAMLKTSVGAVKSALSRGRGRLDARKPPAGFDAPPAEIVEQFMTALGAQDMETMKTLCSDDLTVELVGGAQGEGWEQNKTFFAHAHMVMPALGFGENPRWEMSEYDGEPVVLGFRTLGGVEGLNEVHRLETVDGKVVRDRCYCFCPETLASVAEGLGLTALPRPHRSPTITDFLLTVVGVRPRIRAF